MTITTINKQVVNQLQETEPRWFAVRTRAKSEKAVCRFLEKKGVTTYLPLQEWVRQYERKKRIVALPLIAGYVFVWLVKSQYVAVLETQHVVGFVKHGSDLMAIPQTEIDLLRRITLEKDVRVEAIPGHFTEGDAVEIAAGSLAGLKGRLVGAGDKKRVRIELEQLGYSLMLDVETRFLRRIR